MSGRASAAWAAKELALAATEHPRHAATQAIETGRVFVGAARTFYQGSRGLTSYGRRSAGHAVKGEWFHGAGDRRMALSHLSVSVNALRADLARDEIPARDRAWAISFVEPTLTEWDQFAAHERSTTLAPWVTEWSTFETWWQRIQRLRDAATARGIQLTSPDLAPLPKTIWQRADTGTGGPLDVWISATKTVLFGVMTVIGLAGMYSVLRSFSRAEGRAADSHEESA